jgi:hypothetical protein
MHSNTAVRYTDQVNSKNGAVSNKGKLRAKLVFVVTCTSKNIGILTRFTRAKKMRKHTILLKFMMKHSLNQEQEYKRPKKSNK